MKKDKKRYLAFEVISNENFNKKDIIRAIWDQSLNILGEVETARSELWIIEYNEEVSIGILKVLVDYLEDLRFVLTTMNEINDNKVIIKSLESSGVIRKLKDKYFN